MKKAHAVPLLLLLASCDVVEPWLPMRSRRYPPVSSELEPRDSDPDPADAWATVGEPCTLGEPGNPVPAARLPAFLDRMMAMANAGDAAGLAAYERRGDTWWIPGGSPASVIDRIGDAVLVSLQDGSQAWVFRPSALR